jgi:hypothetical protein
MSLRLQPPPHSFLASTTAVQLSNYNLQVKTWLGAPEGGIAWAGDSTVDNITILNQGALAATSWRENDKEETVVTAIQDEHGKLKLHVWSIQMEAG